MAPIAPSGPPRRFGVWPVVLLLVVVTAAAGSTGYWLVSRSRLPANPAGVEAATTADRSADDAAPSGVQTVSSVALVATPQEEVRQEERMRNLDPSSDGWDTEAMSAAALKQLKWIGKLLSDPKKISADALTEVVPDQFTFSSDPLLPRDLEEVYRDAAITVLRVPQADGDKKKVTGRGGTYSGLTGLVDALKELAAGLEGCTDRHVHFKLFRVEGSSSFVETMAYYEASGVKADGSISQTATWRCRWLTGRGRTEPRLVSIEAQDYEQTVYSATSQTLFADCTESLLGTHADLHEQLGRSSDYWLARIESLLSTETYGHHGLAMGDVNGDGLEDVYLCQPGAMPNRLFVQQTDGTVRDDSAAAGVDVLDKCRSALLVDLDNDGDQDLVVSAYYMLMTFANDGQGHFTLRTTFEDVKTCTSLAMADYDSDGDLDIFACVYYGAGDEDGQLAAPLPYHDANNGGRNVMLRNDGDFRFTNVTEPSGLNQNNRRYSFSAVWEDYDNDGDMDLYVANDFGRNNLYQNNGGRFTDVAAQAGVEDISAGMSVTWADYNHDGLMDCYISNMFSSAGNRIAYQRQFQSAANSDTRSLFQRHARGNSLFENAGDGTFRDVSIQAGVTMGRWAWGSLFADINNDGWDDLLVGNGLFTGTTADDL